jgi:hypothetical protein
MTADKQGGEARQNLVTLQELAFLAGTSRRAIERLVGFEIIEPIRTEPERVFSVEVLPRVTRVLRIRQTLGVSWSSLGLVLDLIERIEILESKGGHDLSR